MAKFQTTTKHGPLKRLRPFFKYFGSKWRAARTYPVPKYPLIIEPFAGSAGYSTVWHNRDVLLNDVSAPVASTWEFLTSHNYGDVMALPLLRVGQSISKLNLSEGAKCLLGFLCYAGPVSSPRDCIGEASYKAAAVNRKIGPMNIWGPEKRVRTASQVRYISHWEIMQGEYYELDNEEATWFIDAPYQVGGSMGKGYDTNIDYDNLSEFCLSRNGQVIVCEQGNATWLNFKYHRSTNSGASKSGISLSREVIYTQG